MSEEKRPLNIIYDSMENVIVKKYSEKTYETIKEITFNIEGND
jgi:hypothetical protein